MAENSTIAVDEKQYVTFRIGEETYGLPVIRVQSINEMTRITRLPNTAEFIKGMINLRGVVIPVIDMRLKFNMPEREYDSFTVIIIVEVRERLIGFIADTVSDVLSIPVASIQETPHFSAKIKTDFIEGIGRKDEDLIIMLDVDKILSGEEIEMLDSGRSASGDGNDKK
jgi:purine-binding chemotaxis protein CheW